MKASSIIAAVVIISASLYCSQTFAQSSGIAADKQKQESLDKQRAKQNELKKKYNALSPEEKVAADKRAKEYKKSGGKAKSVSTTTSPASKPATPAKPAVNSSKTTPSKPAVQNTTTKPAPVFMDANGKPLNKTTAPAKPATKPTTKTTPKAITPKTTTPAAESASEKVKK